MWHFSSENDIIKDNVFKTVLEQGLFSESGAGEKIG